MERLREYATVSEQDGPSSDGTACLGGARISGQGTFSAAQLIASVPLPVTVWFSVSHSRCPAVSTVAK
jgi:hypothetical protein